MKEEPNPYPNTVLSTVWRHATARQRKTIIQHEEKRKQYDKLTMDYLRKLRNWRKDFETTIEEN